MVVSKLTLHGVESRELVVSDSLVLSASLGFLRRSGSKRGSACFGKIWRFPAPFPLDPSPGSEWFAHKGPDGPAQPGMLEELISFLWSPDLAFPGEAGFVSVTKMPWQQRKLFDKVAFFFF